MQPRVAMLLLSSVILLACLGTEVAILFIGYPTGVPEVIVGRVLGTLDSVALLVLGYHYGTSAGSVRKTDILASRPPEG